MRNLLLAVFVLACSFSAIAQNKHPFTFEDMMALKRVEEPVSSPDGKWVLFAAVDVDLKANTKTPHIWVVPLSGNQDNDTHVSQNQGNVGHPVVDQSSGEREIISDQDADRPRWARDGEAVCLCFDQRKRIANLDRGFRQLNRDSYHKAQTHKYCHRGGWRIVVAGWEKHFVQVRC